MVMPDVPDAPEAPYALARLPGEMPRSRLLWQGQDTGVELDGVALVHQDVVSAGMLLFITEDCPYEEALHVYLVGPDHRVRDALEIGAPYVPGLLTQVQWLGGDEVSFVFPADEHWRLRVAPEPRRRWRWPGLPGVRHPGAWWRPTCLHLVRQDEGRPVP